MPGVYGTTVTLITGLAWPLVAGAIVVVFRSELRSILCTLTQRLSSAQTFKVGPVEIGGIFEAAEQRTRAALSVAPTPAPDIPHEQVETSEKLEEQLDTSGVSLNERLPAARARLTKLAANYDRLRAEAPAGEYRTRRMNEIVGLMRTFALPGLPLLAQLAASASPGERLAAVAILQVRSFASYIPWLQARFLEETQVFLLYNTALVLRRLARMPDVKDHPELGVAIAFALERVRAFTGGTPDANTVDVLEDAQAFLS